ncbi:MAG: PorV/PorQ family protein [bacterium]
MKKVSKYLIMTLLCVVLVPGIVLASGEGTTGAQFLKIGSGARAVGMGGAFVALSDDASAIFWNPGGLGALYAKEFSAMHIEWLEGIKYDNLTYVHPIDGFGTLGLDVRYLQVGTMKKTVVNGAGYDETGSFTASDIMVGVAYGKEVLPYFNVGASLKYIKQTIDTKNANAFAADVGLLYDLLHGDVGLSIQNIGTKLKFDTKEGSLPLNIKFGIAGRMLNNRLIISVEGNQPNDGNMNIRAGTEVWIKKFLALRGGYKYTFDENSEFGISSNFTAGIGIGKTDPSDSGYGYQIDYAIVPYGDFGYTHTMSLSLKFGSLGVSYKDRERSKISEATSTEDMPEEGLEDELAMGTDNETQKQEGVIGVAILDLFRDKAIPRSEAQFVERYIRGEVAKSESLSIINRLKAKKILKRNNLEFGIEQAKKETLIKAGEVLGVDKLVIGQINFDEEDTYTLVIWVIDVADKKIQYKDKETYSLINIERAIKGLMSRVREKITE